MTFCYGYGLQIILFGVNIEKHDLVIPVMQCIEVYLSDPYIREKIGYLQITRPDLRFYRLYAVFGIDSAGWMVAVWSYRDYHIVAFDLLDEEF